MTAITADVVCYCSNIDQQQPDISNFCQSCALYNDSPTQSRPISLKRVALSSDPDLALARSPPKQMHPGHSSSSQNDDVDMVEPEVCQEDEIVDLANPSLSDFPTPSDYNTPSDCQPTTLLPRLDLGDDPPTIAHHPRSPMLERFLDGVDDNINARAFRNIQQRAGISAELRPSTSQHSATPDRSQSTSPDGGLAFCTPTEGRKTSDAPIMFGAAQPVNITHAPQSSRVSAPSSEVSSLADHQAPAPLFEQFVFTDSDDPFAIRTINEHPSLCDVQPNNEQTPTTCVVAGDSVTPQQQNNTTFFPRLPSNEVLFEMKHKRPKMIGPYLIGDCIGEGSYGKVKEALDSRSLCRRAVKILKRQKLRKIPSGEQNVAREIHILHRLNHPNVIRLYEVMFNDLKQKMYLFLESCVCSLQEMLDRATDKRLPIWQAHGYFVQLIDGLEYLHGQRIVHKDIKPGNLLLALDESLKITDLGVSEEIDRFASTDHCSSGQGTPSFQPPEIAAGQVDSFSGSMVDVWSSGVTLYNMVSGSYPFEGDSVYKLYEAIALGRFCMPAGLDDRLLQRLIAGMLTPDPCLRLSIAQIKHDDWFSKKHPRTLDRVPLPPLHGDPHRNMTVMPYLELLFGPNLYGDEEEGRGNVISERELKVLSSLPPTTTTSDYPPANHNLAMSKSSCTAPIDGDRNRSVRKVGSEPDATRLLSAASTQQGAQRLSSSLRRLNPCRIQ